MTDSIDQARSRHFQRLTISRSWIGVAVALGVIGGGGAFGSRLLARSTKDTPPTLPPNVVVGIPAQESIAERLQFLGQFSAVQQVELRPQVGGTLTKITFKDGDIVHQGDLLFEIDPTPYKIRLDQASAQLKTARAKAELAVLQSGRADTLRQSGYGTIENADLRAADKKATQAAVDDAEAAVRDARFDLDHTSIFAPFTGRIGSHQVSVGNLVAGSRGATSPTTLLATLMSTDTIYLNFDMSEADFSTFQRERSNRRASPAETIEISLAGEVFDAKGTLDFIDNTLDRSSGTIHARATVQNADGLLTPGQFARVRVSVSKPSPALLVPDASVMLDQSDHIVLTVGSDDIVKPKKVEVGDLRGGLRVIRSGLAESDRVIVAGMPMARGGVKVAVETKTIHSASR